MKYVLCFYDKEKKKCYRKAYDPDKAKFICQTPQGKLYKKPRKCCFYLFNPQGKTKHDKIKEVSYLEAKELIRANGTREQYCEYFSVYDANGKFKTGKTGHITLDETHRIKAIRNASALSMGISEFICYIIDKYDDMDNFHKTFVTHKAKNRYHPVDVTDLT